jgi:hypothetical protein
MLEFLGLMQLIFLPVSLKDIFFKEKTAVKAHSLGVGPCRLKERRKSDESFRII